MNFKVLASIENLVENPLVAVGTFTYDFVTSDSASTKYGQSCEVPLESRTDEESISRYLIAKELLELDGAHLLLLVTTAE